MSTEHTGADLLKVFKELNIELGDVEPNVINGWFDTDDPCTRKILDFLCENLSKDNILSPQEEAEYAAIERPLYGEELEKEKRLLEKKHPNLFNESLTAFEIEVLKDEIEIFEEELEDCKNQLRISKELEKRLDRELSDAQNEELRLNIKKEAAEAVNLKLCQEIDEKSKELHAQVLKCQAHLYNFEMEDKSQFLNSFDVSFFRDKFEELLPFINCTLEESSTDDSISDTLSTLQARIFDSHLRLQHLKMEYHELQNLERFFEDLKPENHVNPKLLSDQLTSRIKSLRSQKSLLLNHLENSSLKHAELQVNKVRLKCAKTTAKNAQSRLEFMDSICTNLGKFVAFFGVLYNLYSIEHSDIKEIHKFFQQVNSFITEIQDCSLRSENMLEILEEFKQFSAQPLHEQYILLKDINKLYTGVESSSLVETLEKSIAVKKQIADLERTVFVDDVLGDFGEFRGLLEAVQIQRCFLESGPTHQIYVMPLELQTLFRKLKSIIEQQNQGLKNAVRIVNNSNEKFKQDKKLSWQNKLWIYFLVNPTKMFSLLKLAEKQATKSST